MKKLNRIMSAAIAACMSLTMFAGAAELDTAANTDKAETLIGYANVVTEDGVVEQKFEYTIPIGANEDEKDEIALQAAAEATGMTPKGRAYSNRDTLANIRNFWIPSDRTNVIRCSELYGNGGSLEIMLSDITDCRRVTISCDGSSQSSIDARPGYISIVFISGQSYEGTKLSLRSGDQPNIFFYADREGQAGRVKVFHNY